MPPSPTMLQRPSVSTTAAHRERSPRRSKSPRGQQAATSSTATPPKLAAPTTSSSLPAYRVPYLSLAEGGEVKKTSKRATARNNLAKKGVSPELAAILEHGMWECAVETGRRGGFSGAATGKDPGKLTKMSPEETKEVFSNGREMGKEEYNEYVFLNRRYKRRFVL